MQPLASAVNLPAPLNGLDTRRHEQADEAYCMLQLIQPRPHLNLRTPSGPTQISEAPCQGVVQACDCAGASAGIYGEGAPLQYLGKCQEQEEEEQEA
jgi:hypothetical protein